MFQKRRLLYEGNVDVFVNFFCSFKSFQSLTIAEDVRYGCAIFRL